MRLTTYTLDPNVVITAVRSGHDANVLRELGRCHAAGKADIAIVALASIDERGNIVAPLEDLLRQLGVAQLGRCFPMCDDEPDVLDRCIPRTEERIELQFRIHHALFPNRAFELEEARRRYGAVEADGPRFRRKWMETRRDVQIAWSHVHYRRDVLITQNQNFFKRTKRPGLTVLGIDRVERPDQVVSSLLQK